MRLRVAMILSALLVLAAACNASQFRGDSKSNKSDDDGRRPSEQGEGLVGYLTDPSQVEYRRGDGKIVVQGGAGSVATGQGQVEGLSVCLQQIAKEELKSILGARGKFGGGAVTTLALGVAMADGSFELTAEETALDLAKLLSLNVTGQCNAQGGESELYASRTSIVFKDAADEAPFGGGDVLFPEYADAWADGDSVPDDKVPQPAFFCSEPAPECAVPLKLDLKDAATSLPITDYYVTFYKAACNSPTKACMGGELESFDVAGGKGPYYPDGEYLFIVEAKGYAAFTGIITAGEEYTAPISLTPQ